MIKVARWLVGLAVGLGMLQLLVPQAAAVPMWSRKYEVSCDMCHAFPSLQLTAQGIDFLRRGHRMEDDKRADKNFPNLLSAHGEWNYEAVKGTATPFESPEQHLHAGGVVSPLFSAYADVNLNSDFETAYVQFTKALGSDRYLTARQGKISPTLIRTYANGLMASASVPLVVTEAGLGPNPFTLNRDSYGLDVGGRWRAIFAQAGIVNGEDVADQASVGPHKDVFVTLEANLPDAPTGVGLYWYRGGYDLADSVVSSRFDRYDRAAVFANVTGRWCRLAGAFLTGTDRVSAVADRTLKSYYLQADVAVVPWATPFARYDRATASFSPGEDKIEQITLGASARLYLTEVSGGRVVLQLSRRRENDRPTDTAAANLLWSF